MGRIVKDEELSGVLVPDKSLNIFPKLSGQAQIVAVDIGDRVRQGQLLVQIDTKELNAQLAVAQAATATVRDQAAQAKIGIESARLNLDLAQKNYDRTKALFDTKAVDAERPRRRPDQARSFEDGLRQCPDPVSDGRRFGNSRRPRPRSISSMWRSRTA